ncbi:hypothetical protein PRZ48_008952 [Zasmidium cellare]|uniref:NAD(P)-binding protein n=1 Tax=Zasmidium cellare TaxID=395010 RepID=A0ABR0EGX6_ZASCE|nr:hypothetical protein PRZ48_008952 [Zasmidium cellare]
MGETSEEFAVSPAYQASKLVQNYTKIKHNDTYPAIDTRGSPDWDCKGKAMLITGANGGVGRAVVQAYARMGASHIGLGMRRENPELVEAVKKAALEKGRPEPAVTTLLMDLEDRASLSTAAEKLEREWGRLDIVISNAGYLPPFEPLLDGDEAEYWKAWEINIRGTYWVAKAFLPLLLKCGGDKTFVAISSMGAHILTPGASSYQTTKFAICRFVEFMMADYGDQGLAAYAMHPASMLTDLASNIPAHMHPFLNDTPELVGDTFAFLGSKKRDWLAGRFVAVCWDMPELMARAKKIVQKDALKFRMVITVMAAFPRTRLPLPWPAQAAAAPSTAASRTLGVAEILENIISFLPIQDQFRAMRVDRFTHNTIAGSKKLRRQMFLDADCLDPTLPIPKMKRNRLITHYNDGIHELDLKRTLKIADPGIIDFNYIATSPTPTLTLKARSEEAAWELLYAALPPAFLDMAFTQPVPSSILQLGWFDPPLIPIAYAGPRRRCSVEISVAVKASSPRMWLKAMRSLVDYAPECGGLRAWYSRGWRRYNMERSIAEYPEEVRELFCEDPVYSYVR